MPYKQIEISIKYIGTSEDAPIIDNTAIAAQVIRDITNHNTILWREEAFILCLNRGNRLLGWHRIAIGGRDKVIIDSNIIATIALQCFATGIILTHNHPGGD